MVCQQLEGLKFQKNRGGKMDKSINKSYYAIIPANVRYDKSLTSSAKLLYGEITALCNAKGYCWASDKYFADLYGVSKTSIQNWIKNLADRGYISREIVYKDGSKEISHRYIKLFNTPTQEKLNDPIQEKLRDNNTSFNTTTNNTINSICSNEFEQLWAMYPKKQGNKKTAQKNYIKARTEKNGVTFEAVKTSLERAIENWRLSRTEIKFIPMAATWFNQNRWNDELFSELPATIEERKVYNDGADF